MIEVLRWVAIVLASIALLFVLAFGLAGVIAYGEATKAVDRHEKVEGS